MDAPIVCTIGHVFPDFPTAKKAIAAYVIDYCESHKVLNSNRERYTLVYKGQ